jgi:hypothetical protein
LHTLKSNSYSNCAASAAIFFCNHFRVQWASLLLVLDFCGAIIAVRN